MCGDYSLDKSQVPDECEQQRLSGAPRCGDEPLLYRAQCQGKPFLWAAFAASILAKLFGRGPWQTITITQ